MLPRGRIEQEENLCKVDSLWDCCGKEIDLNKDGISEYLTFPTAFYKGGERIIEMRGASGNGNILIYGVINKEWKLIGSLIGNDIKKTKIDSTEGYANLITGMHMSWAGRYITEWIWNGNEYESAEEIFYDSEDKSNNLTWEEVWENR